MSKSKVKPLLIFFFDISGLVHHEFVPHGRTVNAKFYVKVLKRLKRRIHRARPDIEGDWKLHHDNAPARTAFLVTSFLADGKVPTVPQPPYSPHVAFPGCCFFPRLKILMKGHHFETVGKVEQACTKALEDIPKKPTVIPSMPGNLAGSDETMLEEPILKPFNALYRSDQ